nr:2-amino-1-hydroxyethylphosphonate dioxygenase (glycine-forming)-like [Lytechinus pictus]
MAGNVDVESVVDRIFRLFDDHGSEDYIGEPVSQTEHMIQCAMQAEKGGYGEEVILGALLHDIGHLVGMEQGSSRMETGGVALGAANHEILGERFLLDLGLPETVCKLVRGHVDAKRYLVYKNEEYRKQLSEASKMTLVHQGGPMDADEAASFEASPHHDLILQMRQWDERAKVKGLPIDSLQKYKEMCRRVVGNCGKV